jgi:hypothetical protein
MAEAENPLALLPSDPRLAAHRGPEDDFFCLRYAVWYPSQDCAYRTRFRTSPGCAGCEQGRFNEKRHAEALSRMRPLHLARERSSR